MRHEAFLMSSTRCEFPDAGEIDADGLRQLLTTKDIDMAPVDRSLVKRGDKLGRDIGGGG